MALLSFRAYPACTSTPLTNQQVGFPGPRGYDRRSRLGADTAARRQLQAIAGSQRSFLLDGQFGPYRERNGPSVRLRTCVSACSPAVLISALARKGNPSAGDRRSPGHVPIVCNRARESRSGFGKRGHHGASGRACTDAPAAGTTIRVRLR